MAEVEQETRRNLEAAAHVLLAPPNLVSSDQRHAAEALFLEFRKTKTPFMLCRYILESSGSEYVLFEAAALLQEAVVREWGTESGLQGGADAEALQSYLLQLVQRPDLPGSVRSRLLQLVAVLVKRASLQDGGGQRAQLLDHLQQMLLQSGGGGEELACGILQSLLEEFGTTLHSADMGLPWEEHLKAKRHFEGGGHLQRIFRLCLQVLGGMLTSPAAVTGGPAFPHAGLLRRLLALLESVLTWNFVSLNLPKKLMGMYEANQNPSLRPGVAWKEVFLESNLIEMFFQLRWLARTDTLALHSWSNCMVQLASLNGALLGTKEDKVHYLSSFLQGGYLTLLGSTDLQGDEVLGLAQSTRNLVLFFPPNLLPSLSPALQHSFLHHLTTLTCHLANLAAQEEASLGSVFTSVSSDDRVAWDSLERLLEAWTVLSGEASSLPTNLLSEGAWMVFQEYLKSHLAPPQGIRGAAAPVERDGQDEEEEVDEVEETDLTRCRDQLQAIGALARLVPQRSLPTLVTLLRRGTAQLQSLLHHLALQGVGIASSRRLRDLQEDLHWLMLVAGWVLAPDQEGETALIPWELLKESQDMVQGGGIVPRIDFPQMVLQEVDSEGEEEPGGDCLVALAACTLRLAHVDASTWGASTLSPAASPLLSASVLWFLRKWSAAYLLPPESLYAHLAAPLQAAFGRDTPSAAWTVRFLLGLAATYLQNCGGESDVIDGAVSLLVSLAECKHKGGAVMAAADSLGALVVILHGKKALGAEGRRGLARALVAIGGSADRPARDEFWGRVLRPVIESLSTDLSSPAHRDITLSLLDCLIGAARATQATTATPLFQMALRPALRVAPGLFRAAANYGEVQVGLLEVYDEAAQRTLCYLPPDESREFCGYALALVAEFRRVRGTSLVLEPGSEEDTYRHILLLMQVATHLLGKDMLDFGECVPEGNNEEIRSIPSEVCLSALDTLLPLLTGELLRFPSLSLQYYKLVSLLCEMHPQQVLQLGLQLRGPLLGSLEAGLTGFSGDVAILCCDALQSLASCVSSSDGPTASDWPALLRPFLEGLLQPLVGGQLAPESLASASSALFALLCALPDALPSLSHALLRHVQTPADAVRLNQALSDLLQGVLPLLPPTRPKRIHFRDNFDKFLFVARGIILIK